MLTEAGFKNKFTAEGRTPRPRSRRPSPPATRPSTSAARRGRTRSKPQRSKSRYHGPPSLADGGRFYLWAFASVAATARRRASAAGGGHVVERGEGVRTSGPAVHGMRISEATVTVSGSA